MRLRSFAPCREHLWLCLSFHLWVTYPGTWVLAVLCVFPSYPSHWGSFFVSSIVVWKLFSVSLQVIHIDICSVKAVILMLPWEEVSTQASIILLSCPHLSSFLFSNTGFPCCPKVECSCETFHKPKWLKVKTNYLRINIINWHIK